MVHYIALIHKDADTDYGVSFPDFPGCISAGKTMDEALIMGREALDGHIRLMAEDGETIPEPSTMDAVLLNPENQDGAPVLIAGPKLVTERYV